MAIKLYKYPDRTTIQASKDTVKFIKKHRIQKEPIDQTLRRLLKMR